MSPYPVYKNKPIDQWKVTELKDELRRRKLKLYGLKEELVRRLDESLRSEMTTAPEEDSGYRVDPENDPQNNGGEKVPGKNMEQLLEKNNIADGNQMERVDTPALVDDSTVDVNQFPEGYDQKDVVDTVAEMAEEDTSEEVHVDSVTVDQNLTDEKNKDSKISVADRAVEDAKDDSFPVKSEVNDQKVQTQLQSNTQEGSYDEKMVDSKRRAQDVNFSSSDTTSHQVYEVSPDLGFQVKRESISTDSVSINEKNELKDNFNANNVRLELEVVKPGIVQPSSNDLSTLGVCVHLPESKKEHVEKQTSLEKAVDVTCTAEVDACKNVESLDGESPEKLNLDRSSGDESMEEDAVENKYIESMNFSDEVEGENEKIKPEVAPVDAMGSGSASMEKDMVSEDGIRGIVPAEKRKAKDQDVPLNERKRRRWNSETIETPEPQSTGISANTPKDVLQHNLKKSFSGVESSNSGEALKGRVVQPPLRAATTSLKIINFLRPFTLKALHELLGKTGTFTDFWMDNIKTHCFVTYSSVEEAVATRNALYNLQWPTNGGRLLTAEFVDPQEVKAKLENITTPTAPMLSPPGPPPALSNPTPLKKPQPPPPPTKKPEDPVVTLDDLFKKTRAFPRIYYLPLSDEQVAARLGAQGKKAQEAQ